MTAVEMAAWAAFSAFCCGWAGLGAVESRRPLVALLAFGNAAFVAFWLVRIAAVKS